MNKTKTKRSHTKRSNGHHATENRGRKSLFEENMVQFTASLPTEHHTWLGYYTDILSKANNGVPVSIAHVVRVAVAEFIERKKEQLEEEAKKLKG